MRLFALALTLSVASFTVASAQTATPDTENGRYSFSPVADGVLRLDTRTGQVSQCSRSDAGWACKVIPDERSALETEIARLQGENATLKKAFTTTSIATLSLRPRPSSVEFTKIESADPAPVAVSVQDRVRRYGQSQ
jgi:hypothetical protein